VRKADRTGFAVRLFQACWGGLEQSEEIGRRLQGRGRRKSSFPPVLLAAASHASSLGPLREHLTGAEVLVWPTSAGEGAQSLAFP
jgi:hypothetical protein